MVEQTADILAEERLQDPLNDRVVPLNVLKMPPQRPLAYERVYTKGNDNPNLDLVKQYLMEGGSFSKELIRQTVGRAGAIMLKEPNLVKLDGKATIVGDIHGQFFDLCAMIRKIDQISDDDENNKLLFLGDYVDRGPYGPEVVLYLLTLKIRYPDKVVLLRGNHESREMTQ